MAKKKEEIQLAPFSVGEYLFLRKLVKANTTATDSDLVGDIHANGGFSTLKVNNVKFTRFSLMEINNSFKERFKLPLIGEMFENSFIFAKRATLPTPKLF